jgi:hypothetical protein
MEMITADGLRQTIVEVLAHGHIVTEGQLHALVVSELATPYRKGVTEARVARLAHELATAGRIEVDASGIDGNLRYRFPVASETIQRNTDELFEFLAGEHARAAASQSEPYVRNLLIKSAKTSEWHVLWAAMTVPAQRRMYDCDRISKRLDELRCEFRGTAQE